MKTETFGFTIETAYGKSLATPLTVDASYDAYQTYAEVPANELPSEKEIVNFLNAKAKASARASATTEALKDASEAFVAANPGVENPFEKPTLKTSPEMRFNTIVNALVAGGIDEATAKQQATALTGISPA